MCERFVSQWFCCNTRRQQDTIERERLQGNLCLLILRACRGPTEVEVPIWESPRAQSWKLLWWRTRENKALGRRVNYIFIAGWTKQRQIWWVPWSLYWCYVYICLRVFASVIVILRVRSFAEILILHHQYITLLHFGHIPAQSREMPPLTQLSGLRLTQATQLCRRINSLSLSAWLFIRSCQGMLWGRHITPPLQNFTRNTGSRYGL